MATAQPVDQAKQEAFVNKVLGDTSATMTTILASIGDRLGLFKDLAANGSATSAEVASRTGTNERYVREWLGGMAAAGYVEYNPATRRFTLPAEHAAAIATEDGPFFFGGIHQMLPALVAVVDQVTEAFHKGGGVRQANYPSGMWDGLERFTAGWFNNLVATVDSGDAQSSVKIEAWHVDRRCWLRPRPCLNQARAGFSGLPLFWF